MPLKIAIVGRPNVGKSTLFNRLAGRRAAIVHDMPGVTRDWQAIPAQIARTPVLLIDTPGFEDLLDDSLEARMRQQAEVATRSADVVLFMIDARTGITPLDERFAKLLRTFNKPVILLANKAESSAADAGVYEAFKLGLGEPVAVSAEHGQGLGELSSRLLRLLPAVEKPEPEEQAGSDGEPETLETLKIAIVGRPNAGKSTLINTLLDEDRLLTGAEAGITRDSITVDFMFNDKPYQLIDTAGLRKKARVKASLEKLSVADTLESIQYAHAVVLLVDATLGLDKQDFQIAEHIVTEGRLLIVALNKWDQIKHPGDVLEEMRYRLGKSLSQLKDVPLLAVSGLKGKNLDQLFITLDQIYAGWNRRISTAKLNDWLQTTIENNPPPIVKGRRIKIRYMTQPKTRPPRFVLFANMVKGFPGHYEKYLLNQLRQDFDLAGVPLRLTIKTGNNPYVDK